MLWQFHYQEHFGSPALIMEKWWRKDLWEMNEVHYTSRVDHSYLNNRQNIAINLINRVTEVRGGEVSLTPKEFNLLWLLSSHPKRVYKGLAPLPMVTLQSLLSWYNAWERKLSQMLLIPFTSQ